MILPTMILRNAVGKIMMVKMMKIKSLRCFRLGRSAKLKSLFPLQSGGVGNERKQTANDPDRNPPNQHGDVLSFGVVN